MKKTYMESAQAQARNAVDRFLASLELSSYQEEREARVPGYVTRSARDKYGERVFHCNLPDRFVPVGDQYLPYTTNNRDSDDVGGSSIHSNLCAFFGSGYTSQIMWARGQGFFQETEEDYAIFNGDFKNCW